MKRYILFAIALCVTAVYMFPLYWMYITVFKSASEMFRYPPTFWPQHPESHLWQVFSERGMGNFLWNSFFSGMDGAHDLFISAVLHKAYVDLDEEGTEAAAATGTVMSLVSAMPVRQPTPVFRADHPFIFFIRDTQSGAILFLGRITDPTKP